MFCLAVSKSLNRILSLSMRMTLVALLLAMFLVEEAEAGKLKDWALGSESYSGRVLSGRVKRIGGYVLFFVAAIIFLLACTQNLGFGKVPAGHDGMHANFIAAIASGFMMVTLLTTAAYSLMVYCKVYSKANDTHSVKELYNLRRCEGPMSFIRSNTEYNKSADFSTTDKAVTNKYLWVMVYFIILGVILTILTASTGPQNQVLGSHFNLSSGFVTSSLIGFTVCGTVATVGWGYSLYKIHNYKAEQQNNSATVSGVSPPPKPTIQDFQTKVNFTFGDDSSNSENSQRLAIQDHKSYSLTRPMDVNNHDMNVAPMIPTMRGHESNSLTQDGVDHPLATPTMGPLDSMNSLDNRPSSHDIVNRRRLNQERRLTVLERIFNAEEM